MQENSTKRDTPETESVEARERHVARADLQGKNVINETEQRRHHDEKDHRRAMHGEELVECVGVEKIVVRHCQLEADEKRFQSADDEKEERRHHIKNSDPFVINGGEPGEPIVGALGRIE